MQDWCPEIPWNSCHLLPNHPLMCILTLPCLACQICSDKPADRPERCRESSHEQASPYSNWAGRPCVRANCIMSAALRLQLCTALGGEGVICTYCRFQRNCPLLHLWTSSIFSSNVWTRERRTMGLINLRSSFWLLSALQIIEQDMRFK